MFRYSLIGDLNKVNYIRFARIYYNKSIYILLIISINKRSMDPFNKRNIHQDETK